MPSAVFPTLEEGIYRVPEKLVEDAVDDRVDCTVEVRDIHTDKVQVLLRW